MTARELLDRHFLEMRHRLLDLAAAFDRIERSDGATAVQADTRIHQMRQALNSLVDGKPDRAERVQMFFSLPYDPAWRTPRH